MKEKHCKCPVCDKRLSNPGGLKQHMFTPHWRKAFQVQPMYNVIQLQRKFTETSGRAHTKSKAIPLFTMSLVFGKQRHFKGTYKDGAREKRVTKQGMQYLPKAFHEYGGPFCAHPRTHSPDFGSLWSEFGLDSSTPRYKCYQNECDFTSNKILEFEAHLKKHLRFNYTSTSSCRPKNQGYSSSLKIPPEKKLTDRLPPPPSMPRRKQELKPDLTELTAKKPPTFFISEAEIEDEPSLSSSKMNSSMILTVSVPEPVVLQEQTEFWLWRV
ncbi:hypothetical protein Ocin01_14868 [Orchesella cincta]|uniref:C2H2-type domain-containing protein n=1 Tax=Orchesella cincta TaxID=48709 RepID=A0A1D2MG12_ORCCI|nr:hypothetical protein Ocin01_14868 [Orchesella cincta]